MDQLLQGQNRKRARGRQENNAPALVIDRPAVRRRAEYSYSYHIFTFT